MRIRPFRDLSRQEFTQLTFIHSFESQQPLPWHNPPNVVIVEGIVIRGPYSNLVLTSTPLVPEIIQHEAAMHFGDEVGHVVYKSVAKDFAYGSVDEVEPGLRGGSKTKNHLSRMKN